MKRFAIIGLVAAFMTGCVRVEYPVQSTQSAQPSQALPFGYAQPVNYATPLGNTLQLADARPAQALVQSREAVPQRVVYRRATERRVVSRQKRSIGTSALIIGGSAAGGAGIGALIGGKRGAGIGALAGGGAAALWDQITRRKN
jgi:hypothetical protein